MLILPKDLLKFLNNKVLPYLRKDMPLSIENIHINKLSDNSFQIIITYSHTTRCLYKTINSEIIYNLNKLKQDLPILITTDKNKIIIMYTG